MDSSIHSWCQKFRTQAWLLLLLSESNTITWIWDVYWFQKMNVSLYKIFFDYIMYEYVNILLLFLHKHAYIRATMTMPTKGIVALKLAELNLYSKCLKWKIGKVCSTIQFNISSVECIFFYNYCGDCVNLDLPCKWTLHHVGPL